MNSFIIPQHNSVRNKNFLCIYSSIHLFIHLFMFIICLNIILGDNIVFNKCFILTVDDLA